MAAPVGDRPPSESDSSGVPARDASDPGEADELEAMLADVLLVLGITRDEAIRRAIREWVEPKYEDIHRLRQAWG